MFLNIDYAKRAAAREKKSTNNESLVTTQFEDDDIDYEQLFDDQETLMKTCKPETIIKTKKRVRFAPIIHENSLTPTLSRPSSIRPTFEVEFDFDSLESSSIESTKDSLHVPQKSIDHFNWKDAFLSDLHIAKKTKPTIISSPSIVQIETKTNEDTLWDFMKESNPELLEKLERTTNEKQRRLDRFSIQQPTSANKTNIEIEKTMSVQNEEGIRRTVDHQICSPNLK
ncbi:hypothetical protein I4U23_018786 [Adineta vaga]|nr:hypothetical protein I4U23_018786 [Adineta vaga]